MPDTQEAAALQARLDGLEIRIAHQDQAIAELNDVVTQQWQSIDALNRQMQRMLEEVQALTPAREGPEPPPPHY